MPVERSRVRRVALTGGIATGKSHVRAQFEALGVPTIDADSLARDAVATGTDGLASVISRFGTDVLDPAGALDRHKLANIVFADPAARRDLERIIHPFVRRSTDAWFASLDPLRHPIAMADIPLLYEAGREVDFDTVIVTRCDTDTQIRRLMERNGVSVSEARQRIAAQLPVEEKARRADFVIDTDGSMEDTNRQVKEVFQRLRAS